MSNINEILAAIIPTERVIYTGKDKPRTYCTFQRVLENAALSADDDEIAGQITYRVTLFSKTDYESTLETIKAALKAAGFYINAVEGEDYETDTGYYKIPITVQTIIS